MSTQPLVERQKSCGEQTPAFVSSQLSSHHLMQLPLRTFRAMRGLVAKPFRHSMDKAQTFCSEHLTVSI